LKNEEFNIERVQHLAVDDFESVLVFWRSKIVCFSTVSFAGVERPKEYNQREIIPG